MSLKERLKQDQATLSFEFFPPKDEKGQAVLEETALSLAPIGPDFVSVTDKVGGQIRNKTRDVCHWITETTKIPSMAHLTCLGATRDDLKTILDDFYQAGIHSIMALRGDPPPGKENFEPHPDGCQFSGELIELIREDGRFTIGCAAYPDGHPEADTVQKDWDILLDKFKKGADFGVTQLFFENNAYGEMLEHLQKNQCEAKIIPGILPITQWKNVKKFCDRCGATIPQWVRDKLDPYEDNPVDSRRAGMEFVIEQCIELREKYGAPGLHIYSLNRSTAAAEIVTCLRREGAL